MLTDIRYALRQLRKSPGFTLTAVLTFMVAIGGVVSVFSIVESILLRPLPFQESDRLVSLHEGIASSFEGALPAPDVIQFARDNRTFTGVGGFVSTEFELAGAGEPFHARAERVTATLFPVLGVKPMLGRNFTQHEDDNAAPVAILSYALWHTRYHDDPNILGRGIDLDRRPYTVIGIMPRNFEFPLEAGRISHRDLWVPMSFTPEEKQDETDNFQYGAIARLKPNTTLAQAQVDLHRMVATLDAQIPPELGIHLTSHVVTLKEETVKSARPLLRILMFAVVLVLGIACVNLANLLLVRATGRHREFGVRLALGAARRLMIRQLLVESLLLSSIGGGIGIVLAMVIVHLGGIFLPSSLPRIAEIAINGQVLLLAVALIGMTGILCGMAPVLSSIRVNILDSLHSGGQATGSSYRQHRFRHVLVVIETALALLLLVGSGLLLRSFAQMLETDPGFTPRHVLTAHLSLPQQDYPTQKKVQVFYAELVRKLAALPQVRAVGAASNIPVIGLNSDRNFVPEGYTPPKGKPAYGSGSNYYVLGDYFKAMRIPLIAGRYFSETDDQQDAPLTVIVSQSLADYYWPGQNAVGKRLKFGGNPLSPFPLVTVVGVVGDIRQGALDQKTYPQIYEPFSQLGRQFGMKTSQIMAGKVVSNGYLVLSTEREPLILAQNLLRAVHQLDPLLALEHVEAMDTVISATEESRRFNTAVLTGLASTALFLSLLGIYGVLASSVNEHARDIAIRMALGATRERILGDVLCLALLLSVIGIGVGLAASFYFTHFLANLLYKVRPFDAPAYLGAMLVLLMGMIAAGWLPARRAASMDPMKVLRSE